MFAWINTRIVYFHNGVRVVAIFQNHNNFPGIMPQSLATDMRRLFYSTWPPSFSSYIKKGEESDHGYRIKQTLYICIKRLCIMHILNTVNIVSHTMFGYDINIYTNAFGGYKWYQVTKQCVVPFINYMY